MKRYLKSIALAAACGLAMPLCLCAQEQGDVTATKAAKVYVPEQGDFAIGFDVTPVLRYVGNFFNGNTNNTAMDNGLQGSPAMDGVFQGPVASIMAKYMLTDRMGLRANIGLLNRNTHDRLYVDNDVYSQLPHDEDVAGDAQLIDHRTVKVSGGSINIGPEWRVGKRRVQGVFGVDAMVAFQNTKTSYAWGNALTDVNQSPTTSWQQEAWVNNYRTLEHYNQGHNVYAGLLGHVGVEFFVAPKIALGAEVNVNAYWQFGSQEYRKSEGFNAATGLVETRTDLVSPAGLKEFYFGTENLGGALYMMFYF